MAINDTVYQRLKQVARSEQTISYSSIAPLVGLDMENPDDRVEIGRILDEINLFEHAHGRPMLSVVVIREDLNYPGHGFFELARRLGLHHGHRDVEFFVDELRRVYRYWGAHRTD